MSQPFGPVPVSRLKAETAAVFGALAQGRTVLVSRHGHVVAQIDPPDQLGDFEGLITFAVTGRVDGLNELSATTIGQRSPSRIIRAAEDGVPAYVTKDGRLLGFLRPRSTDLTKDGRFPRFLHTRPTDRGDGGAAWVEQQVTAYELAHPDATAEELAAYMDGLQGTAQPSTTTGPLASPDVFATKRVTVTRAAALGLQVTALVRSGRVDEAEQAYHDLLGSIDGVLGTEAAAAYAPEVTEVVGEAMVSMGTVFVKQGRPEEALVATREALDLLASGGEWAAQE